MRYPTAEEKRTSRELIRPFILAMGKNTTQADVARITGVSPNAISRWLIGMANLLPENQEKIQKFIDNPPISTPKWKDSDRNR